MIEVLGSLLSSSGMGAVVGMIGSYMTKKEERATLKLKLDHEYNMAEIRAQEAEAEFKHEIALADKAVERAKVEGAIQKDIGELTAFTESLKEQTMQYGSGFADKLRAAMRPLITTYLLVLSTVLAINIFTLVGGLENGFSADELLALYKDVIAQLLFLTTTSVTWWFGSRPSSQRK